MLVFAAVLAPESLDEFRVDSVGAHGYSDTMIVRRVDHGFEVYDEMNGKLKRYMTIKQSADVPGEFVVTNHARGREETVNLGKALQKVDVAKLRTAERMVLKLKEGGEVRLDRSGSILYLSSRQSQFGHAVHCYPTPKPAE
jgi:imidazoleglycerol phosphate dehydratase HisB